MDVQARFWLSCSVSRGTGEGCVVDQVEICLISALASICRCGSMDNGIVSKGAEPRSIDYEINDCDSESGKWKHCCRRAQLDSLMMFD